MIATEALSKDDSNLIEGEIVDEMTKLTSPLAIEFKNILLEKLSVRRNSRVTSLVFYLMNNEFLSKNEIEKYPLKLENKKSVQQVGTNMLKRLYEETIHEDLEGEDADEETNSLSFQEILKKNIEKQLDHAKNSGNTANELNTISKDFKFYDLHKKKSPMLEKLFLSLCSIQPTSVQSG